MLPVLANAGTAVMWFTAAHLCLWNAGIGVGEGLLLAWAFGARHRWKPAIAWMILANYVSAWAGVVAVNAVGSAVGTVATFDGARLWIASALALSWALTVLMEWPFVRWALGVSRDDRRASAARSLRASLVLQASSYALLIPYYAVASRVSFLTQTTVVDASEIAAASEGHVYVIDPDGRGATRVALDGTGATRVAQTAASAGTAESIVRIEATAADGRVKLWFVDVATVETPGRIAGCGPDDGPHTARTFGPPAWEIETGFWDASGLRARHAGDGATVRLALETPFLQWRVSDATLLPGGRVVCAAGPNVLLIDLATRRVAVLAAGSDPVVVLAP